MLRRASLRSETGKTITAGLVALGCIAFAVFLISALPERSTAQVDANSQASLRPSNSSQTPPSFPQRYNAQEQARYQQTVLQAYNCVRRQQNLPPYSLSESLSYKAEQLWLQQATDRASADQLAEKFPLIAILALQGMPEPGQQPQNALLDTANGCAVGGVELANLPRLANSSKLGIMVFPPQSPNDTIDGGSAAVLGR